MLQTAARLALAAVHTVPVTASGGVTLQVQANGCGMPLLLLHGFPDSADVWHPLLPALAAQHRVWAPDLRGYRDSGKPPAPADYAIDALLADLLALIDRMAGTQATVAVAGHDWGGVLAWALAARHPQRVSRLVVLNAPHPVRFAELLRDDAQQRAASAYIQRLTQAGAAARLAADDCAVLRAMMRGALPNLSADELDAMVAGWSVPGALPAMLNWYHALDFGAALAPGGVAALPSLGSSNGVVEAPTLLLWGERDAAFVAANLDGLQRWVPRLQLQRFADAGHWLLRERPADVAAAMLRFLAA